MARRSQVARLVRLNRRAALLLAATRELLAIVKALPPGFFKQRRPRRKAGAK